MLAEIRNKISSTGSNLSERLEDKLTGDFFGAIRYLPFELGLKLILNTAEFIQKQDINNNWKKFIEKQSGYELEMKFWYKDEEGEIDLLLYNDNVVIGIEIKYLSGLSSEDQEKDGHIDYKDSVEQLARYSRMIDKLSNGRESYLLFLAPYVMMASVKKKHQEHPITAPSVGLGFMCWQDILKSINTVNYTELNTGQSIIINDLKSLLVKKGFNSFNGFVEKVLNISILKDNFYSFGSSDNIKEEKFSWPLNIIKENSYYVYKHN